MFPLESPHPGDSNENTQYTIFNIIKRKSPAVNYPKYAAMEFFRGTQERVRNSRGKQAILKLGLNCRLHTRFYSNLH